jgi:hypothetical protein
MLLSGLLIKESLQDESVLDLVRITQTETWRIANAAPNQPTTWTAIQFEAEAHLADELAAAFSHAMRAGSWYLNFSFDNKVYVVFPKKVFKYIRGNPRAREQAIRFGRALKIPGSQLDWDE